MADASVRPAVPADADEVARVQLETWRAAYSRLLPASALEAPHEEVAGAWRRAVELPPSPAHRLLVALEGSALVGFAACAPDEEDPATGELTTLLVEPRWGRRGHGSRLVAAAVDLWRADGVALARCWAWEKDGVTQAFLRSAGWEADGLARGLDTGPRVERQLRWHTSLDGDPTADDEQPA